jgi:threonine dehydrogenase-like Zn-dependent dehydrogenase
MRAIRLHNQQFQLDHNYPMPSVDKDEVLVKVRLAAICGTDLELARGYYEFDGVPGHEFVGEIASGPEQGQRVVADINIGCWQCSDCQNGRFHHCSERSVLGIKARGGAFSEYIALPRRNLVAVNSDMPDEVAVLAEPVAAALRVVEPFEGKLPKQVLVIGAGRLGYLVAQVLRSFEIEVLVYTRNETRVAQLARANLECVDEVQSAHFPWVVDCSGSKGGLALAIDAVAPRGTITLKSTITEPVPLDLQSLMVNEVSLVGSRCGDLGKAEAWLSEGHLVPPTSARFGIDHFDEAIRAAMSLEWQKVLIDPQLTLPSS